MEFMDLLNRYSKKSDYFYRLRIINKKKELLVYYRGIKMFGILDNKITPSISVFLPNSKNNNDNLFPQNAEKQYNELKIRDKNIKVFFKKKPIEESYTDYKTIYNRAKELDSEKRRSICFDSVPTSIMTLKDICKWEEIFEYRINLYENALDEDEIFEDDFGYTECKGKREKDYQLELMNILNFEEQKEKIINKNFFTIETFPLEVEYELKTKEKKNAFNNKFIPNGRIDNILIEKSKIKMVEIKIGTQVIAGTNGIHKHLIDILYCLKNRIITVNDFNNIVKQRSQIWDEDAFKNYICKKLEYDIICGYGKISDINDNDEKTEVKEKIDDIMKKSLSECFFMTQKGNLSNSNKLHEKYEKMKTNYDETDFCKNVKELINDIKKYNCEVKIYLSNYDYTNIEEYSF